MKLKYILFLFYFSLSFFSFAQAPQKIWDKTLGGQFYETEPQIISTSDGGFLMVGTSNSNISGTKSENIKGNYDYWIVKINNNGQKVWDKTIGGISTELEPYVIETSSGDFVIAGSSYSNISFDKTETSKGGLDYWVVKINTIGQILWDKTIGGNYTDFCKGIIKTNDGGVLLIGSSDSEISGDKTSNPVYNTIGLYEDFWVVKLDGLGNKVWDKTFGGASDDIPKKIIETHDGGFVIVGKSGSYISGDKSENPKGGYDYWVVKISNNGIKIWDRTLGGSNYDEAMNVVETQDYGLLIGGNSASNISSDKSEDNLGQNDYWIIKLTNSGVKVWDKSLGGSAPDNFTSINKLNDDNFLICGYSYSNISASKSENAKGSSDYWVVKVNSIGQKIWDKTIGGGGEDDLTSSLYTNDGNIILAGKSWSGISYDKSEDIGNTDFWVVKLGSEQFSTLKLTQSPIFSGGIPELTTGKTYNLEFGLKKTGTTDWQGDIYWKLNNGTYRLSNSNISIPVGGSGVFTTSYSPTTSEVGNNLPVAIYTKTTGSGVYDLAGVVNGTQNPISINIKLPSTAVEKPIPFIRLDKAEYLPGEVVRITGGNFIPGAILQIVSDIIINIANPMIITNADGSFSTQFTIPSSSNEKSVRITAQDPKGYNPQWSALIKQPETANLKIINPYQANSTLVNDRSGASILIKFSDKILASFANSSVSTTRKNYQYNIGFRFEGSGAVNQITTTTLKSAVPFAEIKDRVTISILDNAFYEGSTNRVIFVVTDAFNNQRVAESPVINVQTINSRISIGKKWDKSFSKTISDNPNGVVADGVARIYLVAKKTTTTGSLINSVSVTLSSDDGVNDAAWLGKIKFASIQNNNSYSEEANGITTITAASNTQLSEYWFWYVAPDDFMRNGMTYSDASLRIVKADFTFTFADGTSVIQSHNISIVRPPVMLVHGLGGSAESTWSKFPLKHSYLFEQIEAVDMYPSQYFNVNAVALIGKDPSKRKSSFQYQLQMMREKGYACNQVDYVCHSMGGSMLRATLDNFKPAFYQTGTQVNNSEKTYGQGFVNKFITIDTPHNGSPWGDLITIIAPELPIHVRLAMMGYNYLSYSYNTDPIYNSFITPDPNSLNNAVYSYLATGAVENLQIMAANGGVDFKEMTGIPSHLIAGDIVQGSQAIPNVEGTFLDIEQYQKVSHLFYNICEQFAFNKRKGDEPSWYNDFSDYMEQNYPDLSDQVLDPLGEVKFTVKALEAFSLFAFRYNNIFFDGDIIVPLVSQTAGITNQPYISVLNDHLIDIGKFHTLITEDNSAANKTKVLLNSSVSSTFFTNTLPTNSHPSSSPFALNATKNLRTSTVIHRPFVEMIDTNSIKIVSPQRLSDLEIDRNVVINVNVKNLTNLKKVELIFQGNRITDTTKNNNYSFYPTINRAIFGKQLVMATATYIKNDTVFYKSDSISFNVKTNESVEIFRVSPKYKNIDLDEKFTPVYDVGYGKFITHYVESSKLTVNISNASVINYDNAKGRFVGLQKGESQVVFTYEGKKDTIYIAVADGGVAYTSAITTGTIATTTVCPGGVLQVPYTTTGTFGVGNEFLIQISDLTGENFQILETIAGTNLTTYLPNNLKVGSYKVRVISTNDPIIGTVSSSTIVVQKYSNPPTLVASKTSFVEGERLTLISSGCPSSFQFAHTPNYGFANGTPVTVSPLTDTKIECFCVNSNNTCYSESATPIYLTKEVCSPNKSIIYSSGLINYEGDRVNIEEAADYIASVNKLNLSNTNNEYHAGKYVLLNPGFEVKGGATFKASINGCNNTNTTNLLGYYPFNFYGIDESGNKKTMFYSQGFYTGGQRFSLVAGKNTQNKAISVDSSPVSAFSNLYQLSSTNQSSYSLWVKTNININNNNNRYSIISQSVSSGTPLSFTVGYETTDGSYYCEIANSNSSRVGKKIIMPNNNQWTHIVVTFKYAPAIPNFPLASSDFSIYINGVKITNTSNILLGGISGTEINTYKTGNYQFFNYSPTNTTFLGQFDDFRLYDKALTDAEVLQIYNSEKP